MAFLSVFKTMKKSKKSKSIAVPILEPLIPLPASATPVVVANIHSNLSSSMGSTESDAQAFPDEATLISASGSPTSPTSGNPSTATNLPSPVDPTRPDAPSLDDNAPMFSAAESTLTVTNLPSSVDPTSSDAQAFSDEATPIFFAAESTSTPPVSQPQSTATSGNVPQAAQIYDEHQVFQDTLANINEGDGETVQVIDGEQEFYGAVTNENVVSSICDNVNQGNINSFITEDTVQFSGWSQDIIIPISQRTTPTPNTLPSVRAAAGRSTPNPPPRQPAGGAAQVIKGKQIHHKEVINTNTSNGGTAQLIQGGQVYKGPVVNRNTRRTNINNVNAGNQNSEITGNTVRYTRTPAPPLNAGMYAGKPSNMPNNQPLLLTNSSGQGAFPLSNDDVASILANIQLNQSPEVQQMCLQTLSKLALQAQNSTQFFER